MDNLKMHTPNKADENFKKLAELFPNAVTETIDENGVVVRAIDKDVLMQEINTHVVDGKEERYQFTWPDKKKSVLLANAPINKTLRPCREESVGKDGTPGGFDSENLYIEGDNLEVLKLLQETYLKKIDVIYIDPPYNTGRNLIYKNDFASSTEEYLAKSGQYDEEGSLLVQNTESNGRFHTDWLNMIYARLKMAKQLLSDTGIIVLTIDDCEIETITMLMNEIFGESNHLATIVIKNNPSGRSTISGASISHEYALFYSKNFNTTLGRLPRTDAQIARYKESDDKGLYEWVNFRKHGGYKEDAPTMYYPIFIKKDASSFRIPKLIWDESRKEYTTEENPLDDEIVSYPIDEDGRARRWKWSLERARKDKDEMTVRLDRNKFPAVYIKARMKDQGMLPLTVWDDTKYSSTEYGTNFLTTLMGKRYFDYPKSIYAVLDCLKVANAHKSTIILDFFSGSATTAHAVMQLNAEDGGNRKFIMVQLPEKTDEKSEAYKAGYKNICEIGKERIRRAATKIKSELPQREIVQQTSLMENIDGELENENSVLDLGFRVLKCDSSNMKDVYYRPDEYEPSLFESLTDNIKEDRTPEDLLFQVMLDLGVLLSSKIEETVISGKKVFQVEDNFLIACFDDQVTEEVITEVAKRKPYYFVMRDSSMANDSVAANFEQIFATYSPDTVRKVL